MAEIQACLDKLFIGNRARCKNGSGTGATLLMVIGEEAHDVFSTFKDWAADGEQAKIEPLM